MAVDPDRLLAYHDRTKHSFESVRAGGHYLDWDNEPSKFKEYPGLDIHSLPPPRPTGVPCHDAVAASADPRGKRGVDTEVLSHVLHHGAGVSRTFRTAAGRYHFRTYASAGALYPIEVYVVAGPIAGLDAGVYHYPPREGGLRRLREGDFRGSLGLGGQSPGEACLILTGIPWRTAWKYQARGFRHLYWDAGMMVANILASAAALEVRATVLLGFIDRRVNDVVGVDGHQEFAVCGVALGASDPPPAEDVPPLRATVGPVSPRPQADPEIEAAREALELTSEDEVRDFRESVWPPDPAEEATHPVRVLDPEGLSQDSIEDVVQRRGSTRRLSGEGFPATEYAAVADAALAGLPSTWQPSAPAALLIASALDGIPPGAYRYVPGSGFRLLKEGSFRLEAGHLCLDQRLGADAAAVTFLMDRLEPRLRASGGRGYAAAQLTAGIVAGRIYLGGYAQCLGVSGITFYDDEAREFFATDAQPMIAVVIGEEAHRRAVQRCRENRRPMES